MGLESLLAKVTDSYERNARLYPPLLALLPLLAMLALLYGAKLTSMTSVVSLAASCGGMFLLSNLGRARGKAMQDKLFKAWGGKPTTQLLRHRDETLNKETKLRYHTFLASRIKKALPDAAQEISNPQAADDLYASAVDWLLEATRDHKKFNLVFKENVNYGFRRNGYGLRPFALASCIVSLLWVVLSQGVVDMKGPLICDSSALKLLPDTAYISLAFSGVMLAVWLFYFTESGVRTAAFTYAEALLRSCDKLASAPASRNSTTRS